MQPIKRILVPTDLSKLSLSAVNIAISLAKKIEASVTLLHVTKSSLKGSGKEELRAFCGSFQHEKRLAASEVREGKPSLEIVNAARKLNINLIVMSSHGRTGLSDMLIGSEAERVVRRSQCPVMTIKPHLQTSGADKAALNVRRILFPTDFSESSYSSLDYALFLAGKFQAKIYVLHVINKLFFYDSYLLTHFQVDELETQAKRASQERMSELVEAHVSEKAPVETIFRFGVPFSEINAAAAKCDVDLIVMATHGSTGAQEMLIGSVAEKVVRHATCPVLTVRPQSFQSKPAGPQQA